MSISEACTKVLTAEGIAGQGFNADSLDISDSLAAVTDIEKMLEKFPTDQQRVLLAYALDGFEPALDQLRRKEQLPPKMRHIGDPRRVLYKILDRFKDMMVAADYVWTGREDYEADLAELEDDRVAVVEAVSRLESALGRQKKFGLIR